ncbi:hypothetical protein [Sporolactobacillus terrae]|uniref:DUF7210 family protein n=1 Tax=Sporolactobacillus terrae TaxID=269673 RepID=UPI000AE47FB7|nr:hypothetical protein [Sporolactobacillus terrae]
MAKYIASAYLADKGKIVKPGETVELTDEQAKNLGDKVKAVPEEKTKKAAPKESKA